MYLRLSLQRALKRVDVRRKEWMPVTTRPLWLVQMYMCVFSLSYLYVVP